MATRRKVPTVIRASSCAVALLALVSCGKSTNRAADSRAVRAANTNGTATAEESQILNYIHQLNQSEIDLAKFGQSRSAQSSQVQQFSKMSIDDHTNLDKQVTDLAKRLNVTLQPVQPLLSTSASGAQPGAAGTAPGTLPSGTPGGAPTTPANPSMGNAGAGGAGGMSPACKLASGQENAGSNPGGTSPAGGTSSTTQPSPNATIAGINLSQERQMFAQVACQLEQTPRGTDFDPNFLRAEAMIHEHALSQLQLAQKSLPANSQVDPIVKSAIDDVRRDLDRIDTLERGGTLQPATPATPPATPSAQPTQPTAPSAQPTAPSTQPTPGAVGSQPGKVQGQQTQGKQQVQQTQGKQQIQQSAGKQPVQGGEMGSQLRF